MADVLRTAHCKQACLRTRSAQQPPEVHNKSNTQEQQDRDGDRSMRRSVKGGAYMFSDSNNAERHIRGTEQRHAL
eukprot:8054894-Pyramimonas_sp.AAC.1